MSRPSKDELRILAWLPSDTRPDEWVTPADLARFLSEVFGHRFTVESTTKLLAVVRREGWVTRRRRVGAGGDAYRRTPEGSTVLIREGNRIE